MKATLISVLAGFLGLAAAEAACKVPDGDYADVPKREDCDAVIQELNDNADEEFETPGCYSLTGCDQGCMVQVCGDSLTLKKGDIVGPIKEIMGACAPDPGQSFQGEVPSGEATVLVHGPPQMC